MTREFDLDDEDGKQPTQEQINDLYWFILNRSTQVNFDEGVRKQMIYVKELEEWLAKNAPKGDNLVE